MATYYVRNDGTAANKAAGTGPASDASACMSVATFNGETFSDNDVIYFSSRGGNLTTGVVIPSSGTSENEITYAGEDGYQPTITASSGLDQNEKSYINVNDFTVDSAGGSCDCWANHSAYSFSRVDMSWIYLLTTGFACPLLTI